MESQPPETRTCHVCSLEKPVSEFYKTRMKLTVKHGLQPKNGGWLCWDCGREHRGAGPRPIDKQWMALPETVKAYLAGLIDGEGCIHISHKAGSGKYDWRLTITNTDESILRWAQEHLGGLFYTHKWQYDHPNWKIRHDLIFTNTKARGIVAAVMPYLVIKRPQAKLMLDYYNRLMSSSGTHITEEMAAKREEIFQQMRILNQKGRIPDELE